jgi:hypothetical protein
VEVGEMRAVSNGYRHSLKPPPTGWNAELYSKRISPTYEKYEKQVYNEFYWNIVFGKTKRDQAEGDYHHEVIKRTAKELNMQYSRTEIKNRGRL